MPQRDLKSAKEAFVSQPCRRTIWEINAVTLTAPVSGVCRPDEQILTSTKVSVLLWSVLQSRLQFFEPYTLQACILDFLINCCAILSATTIYADAPLVLNGLMLMPILLLLVTPKVSPKERPSSRKPPVSAERQQAKDISDLPIKPFVTTYRGTMLVVTFAAILAVDFKVFPRRFGKVENWGTSLMDMGVGSFVFSAGMVAARPVLKQQLSKASQPLATRLRASLRHSLPLIILGLVRLYSVKGLDYAEHVTEYGVHWNFFFTMAFIPPFAAIFDAALTLLPSYAAFAILLAGTYELLLNFTDLKRYIIAAPRVDLLSKNREGIFSSFGYLAIFLTGQSIGMLALPRPRAAESALGSALESCNVVWLVLPDNIVPLRTRLAGVQTACQSSICALGRSVQLCAALSVLHGRGSHLSCLTAVEGQSRAGVESPPTCIQ
ncbi:hypothetical protein MRB53_039807 [Persea americana]|nr:hypothetical protein MRB53_039807 [Persea americana]